MPTLFTLLFLMKDIFSEKRKDDETTKTWITNPNILATNKALAPNANNNNNNN